MAVALLDRLPDWRRLYADDVAVVQFREVVANFPRWKAGLLVVAGGRAGIVIALAIVGPSATPAAIRPAASAELMLVGPTAAIRRAIMRRAFMRGLFVSILVIATVGRLLAAASRRCGLPVAGKGRRRIGRIGWLLVVLEGLGLPLRLRLLVRIRIGTLSKSVLLAFLLPVVIAVDLLLRKGHLRLRRGDDPVIVLGMLEVVFCGDAIAGGVRIARELSVFLRDVERRAANLYVRSVALIRPGERIWALPVSATHALVIVVLIALPHSLISSRTGIHHHLRVASHAASRPRRSAYGLHRPKPAKSLDRTRWALWSLPLKRDNPATTDLTERWTNETS